MYFGPRRWRVYQDDQLVFDTYFTYDDALGWVRDFNAATEDIEEVVIYTTRKDR